MFHTLFAHIFDAPNFQQRKKPFNQLICWLAPLFSMCSNKFASLTSLCT